MIQSSLICNSFRTELFGGLHDLDSNTLKLALFDSSWTGSASTTAYSTTNEISGTGYTAGGVTLTSVTIYNNGDGHYALTCDPISWTSSTFTFRYALLYNSSQGNRAIAIYNFGSDVGVSDSLTLTPSQTAPFKMLIGI